MFSLLSFAFGSITGAFSGGFHVTVPNNSGCQDCVIEEFPLSTYLYTLVFVLIFFFLVDFIVIYFQYLLKHRKNNNITYGFVFKHSLLIHIIVGILSLLFGFLVYRILYWLI